MIARTADVRALSAARWTVTSYRRRRGCGELVVEMPTKVATFRGKRGQTFEVLLADLCQLAADDATGRALRWAPS